MPSMTPHRNWRVFGPHKFKTDQICKVSRLIEVRHAAQFEARMSHRINKTESPMRPQFFEMPVRAGPSRAAKQIGIFSLQSESFVHHSFYLRTESARAE